MNWEAIGAVGEIIAALAVVVSLLYVARQVRESTRQARLSSMQALYVEVFAVLKMTAADRNAARIWLDGLERGLSSLDRYDGAQFGQMCLHAFKGYEEIYRYLDQGVIEESWLRDLERTILPILSFRGFKEWWPVAKSTFGRSFQAYVETRMETLDPDLDFQDYASRVGLSEAPSRLASPTTEDSS